MPAREFDLGAHGTATWAETPGPGVFDNHDGIAWSDVMGLRRGWGTTYRGKAGQASWFHTPVTTVERLAQDYTPVLTEFSVKFELWGTARLQSVHLWNGEIRIRNFDNLNIGPNGPDFFSRTFLPGLGLPRLGIDVAVLVAFGASPSPVTFLGAHATYQVDVPW
jgi:hypothetical protein